MCQYFYTAEFCFNCKLVMGGVWGEKLYTCESASEGESCSVYNVGDIGDSSDDICDECVASIFAPPTTTDTATDTTTDTTTDTDTTTTC